MKGFNKYINGCLKKACWISVVLLCCTSLYAQQKNIYINHYYSDQITRYRLIDSVNEEHRFIHNSHLPHLESAFYKASRVIEDTIPQYYWITDFIFRKSWIEVHKGNFNLYIDPVFNMSIGSDVSGGTTPNNFRNTRGFQIRGDIGKKFSFETSFYENQGRYINYQSEYFASRGERFKVQNGPGYLVRNAVVNGMGRTKEFKTDGLDHAFATGHISYTPIKNLNVQFGYGEHFIGNGYRSLLLSDNSFKYPFLKFKTNFWKNRIQYTMLFAFMNNLFRMPTTTSTESLFERKDATFHYLDFAVTEKFNIGLFEGIVYHRSDSTGLQQFNYNMLNPIIFANTAVHGMRHNRANAVIGLNFSLRYIPKTEIYGQFMVDEFKKSKFGYQLGVKTFDLFTKDLNFQLEYNYVAPYTYAHTRVRQSYSHYNLPLAHPGGAGFHEVVFQMNYLWKRMFVNVKSNFYSKRNTFTNHNTGADIFQSDVDKMNPNKNSLIYIQMIEFGYRFNKKNTLQVFGGWQGRAFEHINHREISHYLYFGLRTTFINENFDF